MPADYLSSAVVIDPLLKFRLVHINQEVEEMRERLSCGAGGGRIEVLYHVQAMVWCSDVVSIVR